MCVVSMIMDHYHDKWSPTNPYGPGKTTPWWVDPSPNTIPALPFQTHPTQDVQKDIDALRKEVAEMKELLKKAVQYDKDNNQPDCEKPEKIALLKKVADLVGVSLDDVFQPEASSK